MKKIGVKREDIPVYRYAEVKQAIAEGRTIFIVESESCADAMWLIGLPATRRAKKSGGVSVTTNFSQAIVTQYFSFRLKIK